MRVIALLSAFDSDTKSLRAHEAAEIIDTIAHSSVEQALGIEQLNRAISDIDRVVQTNAGDVHQSAGLAENMDVQAANICSQVEILSVVVNGRSKQAVVGRKERDSSRSGAAR